VFECFPFFFFFDARVWVLSVSSKPAREVAIVDSWLRGGTLVLVERSKASSLSFSTTDQLALLLGSCTQPGWLDAVQWWLVFHPI
jgi:hypothetical protein